MSERMSLKQVVEQLDLVPDPRPPVDAPLCSDLCGHSWTRAGGGGTCRNCGVTAPSRRYYKGSMNAPASSGQIKRLHRLASLVEMTPDLAAEVENRLAQGLSEREAYALIGELGTAIARIRQGQSKAPQEKAGLHPHKGNHRPASQKPEEKTVSKRGNNNQPRRPDPDSQLELQLVHAGPEIGPPGAPQDSTSSKSKAKCERHRPPERTTT